MTMRIPTLALILAMPSLASADANVPVTTVAPASSLMSSAAQDQAMQAGVDFSRLSTQPGVHIVPLDASPYTGSLAAQIRRDIQMQAELGRVIASDDGAPTTRSAARTGSTWFDRWLDKTYPTLAAARPALRYEPIGVSRTVLGQAFLKEVYPSGKLDRGLWSGVTRTWRVAGLGDVQLSESEHRESGTSITLIREWLNAEVSGVPASLKTVRSTSGKTIVTLAWVSDSTSYQLDLKPLDANALKANEQALMAMANGLGE